MNDMDKFEEKESEEKTVCKNHLRRLVNKLYSCSHKKVGWC